MSRRSDDEAHGAAEERALSILAGTATVQPRELFDLIHAINPTARDMGAATEGRLYALKVRLQSLLIARHGDSLHVRAERPDGGRARHR